MATESVSVVLEKAGRAIIDAKVMEDNMENARKFIVKKIEGECFS